MNYFSMKLTAILLLLGIFLLCLNISCGGDINEGASGSIDIEGCLIKNHSAPASIKSLNVNLFLETSGSMAGFMSSKGTSFQKEVWSVVAGLDTKFSKLFNVFEIRSKTQPLNKLSVQKFRENLNTGGFVSSSSTDIPEMLDSILSKTNDKSVSILISDLIFSPESGSQAQILQITADIKKRFTEHKKSSILLQLNSEFYHKVKINSSPYYIWIIGSEQSIIEVSNLIKSNLTSDFNEINFGIVNSSPSYTILPVESKVENAIQLPCLSDGNFYAYTDFDNTDSDKISFQFGVDLSQVPKDLRTINYLKSNIDIKTDGGKCKLLNVSPITTLKDPDDMKLVKANHLTHMVSLEVSQITAHALVTLNIKKQRPAWISAYDLETNDNFRVKTYGLKKMIEGLEGAYGGKDEEFIFKYPVQILITKNKS